MTNLVTLATRRLAQLVGRAQPSPPSREASFAGVAILTTSRPDARGPFESPVTADLCIDANGGVTVTSVYVEPVQFGSVTCAVTLLPGRWSGTYASGTLRLVLGLHLSLNVLRGAEDSDITVTLTTYGGASQRPASGAVTVAGTATFQGGYLGGRLATFAVNGEIIPVAEELQSRRAADVRPSRMFSDARPSRAVA
jgi:hypothetical protein